MFLNISDLAYVGTTPANDFRNSTKVPHTYLTFVMGHQFVLSKGSPEHQAALFYTWAPDLNTRVNLQRIELSSQV